MRSHDEITWPRHYNCLFSRRKLYWAHNASTLFGIRFVEWVKKPPAYWIRRWGGKTRFLSIILSASRGTMKKIRDRSMKNLLIQWEYWGGKLKDPWSVIGKKPPNLQVRYFLEGKPGKNWAEERFKTSSLAWQWWWTQQVDCVSLLEPPWVWPLVEPYWQGQMMLLAFLNCLCGRR